MAMLVTIRRLGNSHGILIPKPLLKQVGLSDQVEMQVDGNTLVLRKPAAPPRSGWAEASKRIASCGDDALVLPDFANEADAELTW
jgi:antitoxin MazE